VSDDVLPAGFFFAALLSLLEPEAPADSRVGAPAAAPVASELLERGETPVRFEGKLLVSLVAGAGGPADVEPAPVDGLALAPGAFGELWLGWAKALVAAPAAARAATAQSVVIVRIWGSSLRLPVVKQLEEARSVRPAPINSAVRRRLEERKSSPGPPSPPRSWPA
jgi:hypothetical protein